jgi:hypothetical protein
MGIQVEQTVYEVLPTGEYVASIHQIEETEGQYGSQLKFEFVVEGGENDGTTLLGWASKKFSNKSKLYKWARAAFNADIPTDYTFDSDDLIGRKVVLTVVVDSKDDGTEFNRVDAVRPLKHKKSGNGAPPPPPPDFEEDDIPF